MNNILHHYKNFFRNKYWIGISGLNAESAFTITKGNGTKVHLGNVKSLAELFMEIERIAKLEI